MVFSSPVFLFAFLPIILIIYYLIDNRFKNAVLLLSSLIFYAWGEPKIVLLMIGSIIGNYFFGKKIAMSKMSKLYLILSVIVNVSILLYFKYTNFFIQNLIDIGVLRTSSIREIVLPIGISFYTFQSISYLIDVYRKPEQVQNSIVDLGLYISLFPQLVAGPIIRYHDISRQIVKRNVSLDKFVYGIKRFIIGLGKKVIIANYMAKVADIIFDSEITTVPTSVAWLGIVCYTLQIYFDFSGYSDMAIGLGRMFGFSFLENFKHPYIARSIQDFWRRWHISLSNWFRDYLYIPLGGNRKGKLFTYANLAIVFFVTGLWHGASWNFVLWGMFHGFFLIIERLGFTKIFGKIPNLFNHIYLVVVVMIGWVLFRANTFSDAILYVKSMFGFAEGNNYESFLYINNYFIVVLILGVIFSMPIRRLFKFKFFILIRRRYKVYNYMLRTYTLVNTNFVLFILIYCIMELANNSYNPFIYFRF